MSEISGKDVDALWEHLSPMLDDLMARLRPKDRDVLLLRFYEGMSMAQIGEALRISEDAAQKRVSSAMGKLRRLFQSRGIVAPAALMTVALISKTTHAAPSAVIGAIGASGAPSASVIQLAKAGSRMIAMAKLKLAAMIAFFAAVVPAAAATSICVAMRGPAANSLAIAAQPQTIRGGSPATVSGGTFPFEIGYSRFAPGDSITITEISGPSQSFAVGNTYQLRGTYTLGSHDSAVLAVYTTAMVAGQNDGGPYGNNQTTIQGGTGTFSVELKMNIEGYPHLSLYPSDGGPSFGTLYFGTGKYILRADSTSPNPQEVHDARN